MKLHAIIAGLSLVLSTSIFAQNQDIVALASADTEFSTLVSAIQAAGLVETLQSEGPFTVFAPNNEAFSKVPEKELKALLQPANQSKLSSILTYHVVPGNWSAKELVAAIKEGGGKAELMTVQGNKLLAMQSGDQVIIKSVNGTKSTVIQTDKEASNGVVHVLSEVLSPEQSTATSDMK